MSIEIQAIRRDNARLNRIRALPCIQCRAPAPSQAAHSNFAEHGKGRAIKADDRYTIPLCAHCHQRFDQYINHDREQARVWFAAMLEFTNKAMESARECPEVF